MRPLPLVLLLAAAWAWGQEKQEPAKPLEPPQGKTQEQAKTPARPLILRIDQLPASERGSFAVHETASEKPQSSLPDLGGRPSSGYEAHRPARSEETEPYR